MVSHRFPICQFCTSLILLICTRESPYGNTLVCVVTIRVLTSIHNPQQTCLSFQLNLPEGVSVDVVVSSIVDAGHIFIQQPTHPSFPSLERLNQFMMTCYNQESVVPQLPRPLEGIFVTLNNVVNLIGTNDMMFDVLMINNIAL